MKYRARRFRRERANQLTRIVVQNKKMRDLSFRTRRSLAYCLMALTWLAPKVPFGASNDICTRSSTLIHLGDVKAFEQKSVKAFADLTPAMTTLELIKKWSPSVLKLHRMNNDPSKYNVQFMFQNMYFKFTKGKAAEAQKVCSDLGESYALLGMQRDTIDTDRLNYISKIMKNQSIEYIPIAIKAVNRRFYTYSNAYFSEMTVKERTTTDADWNARFPKLSQSQEIAPYTVREAEEANGAKAAVAALDEFTNTTAPYGNILCLKSMGFIDKSQDNRAQFDRFYKAYQPYKTIGVTKIQKKLGLKSNTRREDLDSSKKLILGAGPNIAKLANGIMTLASEKGLRSQVVEGKYLKALQTAAKQFLLPNKNVKRFDTVLSDDQISFIKRTWNLGQSVVKKAASFLVDTSASKAANNDTFGGKLELGVSKEEDKYQIYRIHPLTHGTEILNHRYLVRSKRIDFVTPDLSDFMNCDIRPAGHVDHPDDSLCEVTPQPGSTRSQECAEQILNNMESPPACDYKTATMPLAIPVKCDKFSNIVVSAPTAITAKLICNEAEKGNFEIPQGNFRLKTSCKILYRGEILYPGDEEVLDQQPPPAIEVNDYLSSMEINLAIVSGVSSFLFVLATVAFILCYYYKIRPKKIDAKAGKKRREMEIVENCERFLRDVSTMPLKELELFQKQQQESAKEEEEASASEANKLLAGGTLSRRNSLSSLRSGCT